MVVRQTRFHITLDVLYLTEMTATSDRAVVPPTKNYDVSASG